MPKKHSYFSATWQLNDEISIKLQVQHLPLCQVQSSDQTQFSWQGHNSLLVTLATLHLVIPTLTLNVTPVFCTKGLIVAGIKILGHKRTDLFHKNVGM
jgi:hypothetical protein